MNTISKKISVKTSLKISPKISLKKSFGLCFIVLILGLVFYNTKDLVFGAPLIVHTAVDGSTVNDLYLNIQGTVRHGAVVHINGRAISTDTKGGFNDGVMLSVGYNIIEITQVDRFGKEKRKIVHLVGNPEQPIARAHDPVYQ